jgi:hypothetical protein
MGGFWDLRLIGLLDYYLVLLFVASVSRRFEMYRHIVGVVYKFRGRWPNLYKLLHEHRTILLTFRTLAPALLILVLTVVQMIASRLIWPEANRGPTALTVARLAEYWWAVTVVLPLGVAMLVLDIYGLIAVGQINRADLEKYFDQAEYWLTSRTAHVVRFFTLGFVNPRRLVSQEVQKALIGASKQLNSAMWWTNLQMSLRIAFGLSLWLTWAVTVREIPEGMEHAILWMNIIFAFTMNHHPLMPVRSLLR